MSAAVSLLPADRLTLAVLMSGIASLALSDFVSPFYWSLPVLAGLLRLWRGPRFALSEMQASMIGWFGFFWVALELALGRALVVAFTDFLLILAFAVAIEAPTARNHLHRILVGVFLVLAAAVLTDSVLYLLPLTSLTWFLWRAAACLYGRNWPGGDLAPMPARKDLKPMLAIAAMSALLFIIAPRFDVHSRLKPTQPRMQTSGFSDQVRLGDFARELDATVVMRVAPLAGADPERFRNSISHRYWRGVALSQFTGRGWRRPASGSAQNIIKTWPRGADARLAKGGGRMAAIYREASDHAYLLAPIGLLSVDRLPEPLQMDAEGGISFINPPARRLRLIMEFSEKRPQARPGMRPPIDAEYSTAHTPQALKQWAQSFAQAGVPAAVSVQRIAQTLRSWRYDLHADISDAHPLRSFLSSKRGHCELFATTLALAARELGLAARVVNGYYGGEWNDPGGFLILRQQHAHSWTEVWIDGEWRLIDATPASRWRLSGVRFPALDEIWETIKLKWYRYVLEFQDADRAALLGLLWRQMREYGLMLGAAAIVGLTLVRLGARLRRLRLRARRSTPWPVLDRWLARHGRRRAPHQPLREIAAPEGVDPQRWRRFVCDWEAQAYGGARRWRRGELKRRLRAL